MNQRGLIRNNQNVRIKSHRWKRNKKFNFMTRLNRHILNWRTSSIKHIMCSREEYLKVLMAGFLKKNYKITIKLQMSRAIRNVARNTHSNSLIISSTIMIHQRYLQHHLTISHKSNRGRIEKLMQISMKK